MCSISIVLCCQHVKVLWLILATPSLRNIVISLVIVVIVVVKRIFNSYKQCSIPLTVVNMQTHVEDMFSSIVSKNKESINLLVWSV